MQDRLPFSGFVANFDGKQIQNKEELFRFLEKNVGLPDANNWSSITDWLTDLSWIEILEEDILPWWECDVEKHVVGSKVKSFQVYIVEN